MVPRDSLVVLIIFSILFGVIQASYSPSEEVQAAHKIPHLDTQLKNTDVDISASAEYTTSITVFPSLILAITVLLSFIYLVALLCRCCVRTCCFRCCQNEAANIEEKIRRRGIFEIILMIFLFSAACVDTFLFYGNSKVSKAFLDIANAISILIEWLSSFTPLIRDILQRVVLSKRVLSSKSCPGSGYTSLLNNFSDITSAADSLQRFIDIIVEPLRTVEDYIRETGVGKKDLVEFPFYYNCCYSVLWQY